VTPETLMGFAVRGRSFLNGLMGVFLLIIPPVMPAATSASEIQGIPSVIDGDTLELHGKKIRLFGIDAPESAQECENEAGRKWRCGQRAALVLSEKIGRSSVSCVEKDRDRYQRIVASCSIRNEDLNAWMVANGWALAYRQFSKAYVPLEEQAQTQKAGIWGGRFVDPSDWRRGKRLASEVAPQNVQRNAATERATCAIKGNISSKGERIYHVPGGRYYAQTVIDPSKGERWFCTETEATAAGWRRSKV
jgi:endonuclease YncB( thermonuclease family)